MNKIEVKHFKKKYPTFQIEDLSFSVPKGYITGFIGGNGAGKTTTIKAMLSFMKDYEGTILYEGEDIKKSRKFVTEIGVIMDDSFYAKDWKINQVKEALKVGYSNFDEEKFDAFLRKFQIHETKRVKELSRGMKLKLMLATALSHEATTLVMDEPTSGMDPAMRAEFLGLLQNFMEEEDRTILFSTHITTDLEQIADYIVYIQDGKKLFEGTKDDFLSRFLLVKGDKESLTSLDEKLFIGLRKYGQGFEGLIRAEEKEKLGEGVLFEVANIDKIMVYMSGRASDE